MKALGEVGPNGATDTLYDPTDTIGYTGQTDSDGTPVFHPDLAGGAGPNLDCARNVVASSRRG
jgi:hypothetical protein